MISYCISFLLLYVIRLLVKERITIENLMIKLFQGVFSLWGLQLRNLSIPLFGCLQINRIEVDSLSFQLLPTTHCFMCLFVRGLRIHCCTYELKEKEEEKSSDKCSSCFSCTDVAILKDTIFYFFYGLIIKLMKFIVVFLLKCIDFRVEKIQLLIDDYEDESCSIDCSVGSLTFSSLPSSSHRCLSISSLSINTKSYLYPEGESLLSFHNSLDLILSIHHTNTKKKYCLTIKPKTEEKLSISIHLSSLYFLHPLLFHLLTVPEQSYESSSIILSDQSIPSISSSSSKRKSIIEKWISSLRVIPIAFSIQSPDIDLSIYQDTHSFSIHLSTLQCKGGLLFDMIEGCSLNDSLQIQFLLQLIENSIQSSQTSFSCCLSPSYQFTFSLSSFTAHLQISSISLFSQLLSFFQYLPSSSTSMSRNKIIAFGSNERKQAYLQDELCNQIIHSFPFTSITGTVDKITLSLSNHQSSISLLLQSIQITSPSTTTILLQLGCLEVNAGGSSLLSLPSTEFTLSIHKQPQVTPNDLLTILQQPSYTTKTQFIPISTDSSPYQSFYQHYHDMPLLSIDSQLPPLSLCIDKQVIQCFYSFFLTPSFSSTLSIPSFSILHYEMPFIQVNLHTSLLSLSILNDVFVSSNPQDIFTSLSIHSLDFSLTMASQFLDMDISFQQLLVSSSFRHLCHPLPLETLIGYENRDEQAWKERCEYHKQIPEKTITLISCQASHIHFAMSPECFSSLHSYRVLHGLADYSSTVLWDLSYSSLLEITCDLGPVMIDFDDLVVGDLIWGIITLINLYWAQYPSSYIDETPDWLINDNTLLIQCNSPLLSLLLEYNQQPFQEFQASDIYCEFTMPRHAMDDGFTLSKVECGVSAKGLKWIDCTTTAETREIISTRQKPGIRNTPIDLTSSINISQESDFSFKLQLTWRYLQKEYAPFIEIELKEAVYSLLIRQIVEFSNFFFSSFYPVIQFILYPSLPYRLYESLQHSPLLSSFSSIQLQPSSFTQPPQPTNQVYTSLVNTWPYLEIVLSNVAIQLPMKTTEPSGLVIDIGKGVLYTHKPLDASVPLGSFIRTGLSLVELEQKQQPSPLGLYDHYHWLDIQDDTPIFPRFLIDAWKISLYSTDCDHTIAENLSLFVQFRPKVVFPCDSSLSLEQYPSEEYLLQYHPHFSTQSIPNQCGLPMEVSVEIDSFYLSLLQSQYNQFLLFFFLNLGELPTVCKDPYVPPCPHCSLYHEPLLSCSDCWCVFRILAHHTAVFFSKGSGNNCKQLGQLRMDSLNLYCYLHNMNTQMYIALPTVFAADLLHTVIYPHNASSYQGRIPACMEDDLNEPMLEIKDVENPDGRQLQLTISSLLFNFRPLFLLNLYNWVCDPIWDTANLPEAASWPLKKGQYDVAIHHSHVMLMDSVIQPEPSDLGKGFPAGATFHGILTNRNRCCISFQIDCSVNCMMNALTQSMDCTIDLSLTNTLVSKVREIYQKPTTPSNVQLTIKYGYEPIKKDSSFFCTTINMELKESLLLIPITTISSVVSILSYQADHLIKSMLTTSNQETASNQDILIEQTIPLHSDDQQSQLVFSSSPKEEDEHDTPSIRSTLTSDSNRMVVTCNSTSSFIIGFIRQDTILLSATLTSCELSLTTNSLATNGSFSFSFRSDYFNSIMNCYEPFIEATSLSLIIEMIKNTMKLHFMIPQIVNMNCSYRFLELLKYQVFDASPIVSNASLNDIRIENKLGEDITIVLSELKEMNTSKNSYKHITTVETHDMKVDETYVYSLRNEDSFSVVTIHDINTTGVLMNSSHSYNRYDSSSEKIHVHYDSEAALVLNEEKMVLLSLKSSLDKQYVLAKVTMSPLLLTFLPPIRIENQTSCQLQFHIRQPILQKQFSFSLEPFTSYYLPFHCCLEEYDIQLAPTGWNSSSPLLSSTLSTKKPLLISCELPLDVSMLTFSSSWNVFAFKQSIQLDKNVKLPNKVNVSDYKHKIYSIIFKPILTLENSLQYPINYCLLNQDNQILACGVIPETLSIPLHTLLENTKQVFLRLSLWGYDYSETVLIYDFDKELQTTKKRIQLQQRSIHHSTASSYITIDIILQKDTISIQAPFTLLNKTPFPLYIHQDTFTIPIDSFPNTDSNFLPITPIHMKEKPISTSISSKPMDIVSIPDFKSRLDQLEASFSTSISLATSLKSPFSYPMQVFTCWIASPCNQKYWLSVEATSNTTFEELHYSIMHSFFPGDRKFIASDYYFLWIHPERIIRLDMGEFVCNYADYPRFVLRHNQHGIQGAVIHDSVHVDHLEDSFLHYENSLTPQSSYFSFFSDKSIQTVTLASSEEGEGISLTSLIENEEKSIQFRLPYNIMIDGMVYPITIPMTCSRENIDKEIVYVVNPQYVCHNQTQYPLKLRQSNDTIQYNLPAHSRSIFCYQKPLSNQFLQIGKKETNWDYSGSFSINIGEKWLLKTVNSITHEYLLIEVTIQSTDSFTLITFSSAFHAQPLLIQNYCPFSLEFHQKESSRVYSLPPYHSSHYFYDEPLKESILQVNFPGVKGTISSEINENETKRVTMPALVTMKEDCQLEADVYFQVQKKWKVRTARLADHVLLLYKSAKLTKKLRGGHSSLSLALPLYNVTVKYSQSTIFPSATKRTTLYSQAVNLASSLTATFSLSQLKSMIQATYPRIQNAQLIQDFFSVGILYKLPQDVSTPMSIQQEPLYAFRSHPISLDCCVSLLLEGTRMDLYFANVEIAASWAKKIRFEAETAPSFPPQNWLGANPRSSEIRDVDFRIHSYKQGIIPILTISPYDLTLPTSLPTSFLYNYHSDLDIHVSGIGISMIDSSPKECCYFFVDGLDLTASFTSETQDVVMNINNIQFDITSYEATFPCLLYTIRRDITPTLSDTHSNSDSATYISQASPLSSPVPQRSTRVSSSQRLQILSNLTKQEKETQELVKNAELHGKQMASTCSSCGYVFKSDKRPFFHACGRRQCNQQKCMHINRGLVSMEKIVLKIDELFLVKLKRQFYLLFSFLSSSPIATESTQSLTEYISFNSYNETLLQEIYQSSQKPSFFIGAFSLFPISFIITLKSSLGYDSSDIINLQYGEDLIADRYLSCTNMPIQLKELDITNMNGGYFEIYKVIRKYIVKEVWTQLRTLLSSVDVLGNLQYFKSIKEEEIPNMNYIHQSISSVYAITMSSQLLPSLPFATLPLLSSPSLQPIDLSEPSHESHSSVGRIIGKTVDGVAHVSSKLTRGVAASLAVLLHDNQFNTKRAIRMNRSTDNHFLKGIQSGSAAVGESVWSGLKGIITQPIADVKKKGAVGILTGSLKGAAGLLIKPTVGLLDMISQSTNGIKNSTQSIFNLSSKTNQNLLGYTRCRFPRSIDHNQITDYNEYNAISHFILYLANSYRENEVIQLITNEVTNAGLSILFLITSKRVLLLDLSQIELPVLLFECSIKSVQAVTAIDDCLVLQLAKPISIASFTPSLYKRFDGNCRFPHLSPEAATLFMKYISQLIPTLSPHSQFPYLFDKPSFVSLCKMRCGRFNQTKRRYIAISRNCLYYFRNEMGLLDEMRREEEVKEEDLLAVGVIPLYKCVALKEQGKNAGVQLLNMYGNESIQYIRIISEKELKLKSKPFFSFEFSLEEEASYFIETIKEHDANTHPFDAVLSLEIEFNLMCLKELKLIEKESTQIIQNIE